jgi:hypothetical protein
MKLIRTIILVVIAFTLGFLLRDYTGPIMLPVSFRTVSNAVKPPTKSADNIPGNVEIIYDNGKFTPNEAVIAVGRWLSISNKSTSLMWISSDNPWLSTVRGYGESEQVRVRMDDLGTYHIKNKLNLNASAVIKVVP